MTKPRKRGRKVNAKGRNDTERFLKLPFPMMQSDAFRSLSGNAIKIWIELRCRHNGRNNGEVVLSFREASDRLGVSKSTVSKAFKDLEDRGFIKLRREGQWYGRLANEWEMTDLPYRGNLPTNDWKRYNPKR